MIPSAERIKTAVLFQNGSIGDFLMFMFLAEMLQKSGHADHLTIVVPRNVKFLRGLLGAYPHISGVEVSRRSGWGEVLKMVGHPNLVIVQPTPGKIPFRIKLLGWSISRKYGSEFLGFHDKGLFCGILYSKILVYNTNQLYSENIQNIVRALGAPVLVQVPDLKISPDLKFIQACGLDERRYMVFHPGASASNRAFTVRAAREVIEHVHKRNPEMRVVLSGGASEREFIEEIRSGLPTKERIVTAIGCPAQEIAALIQSAVFYLGTDTGITHLACFLRTPVLVAAHCGTANWLPFYCPSAVVLYRLAEESAVHESREYLDTQRRGKIKLLATVPTPAICAAVDRFVGCFSNETERAYAGVVGENGNTLRHSR